jgi:hypothetical protein
LCSPPGSSCEDVFVLVNASSLFSITAAGRPAIIGFGIVRAAQPVIARIITVLS